MTRHGHFIWFLFDIFFTWWRQELRYVDWEHITLPLLDEDNWQLLWFISYRFLCWLSATTQTHHADFIRSSYAHMVVASRTMASFIFLFDFHSQYMFPRLSLKRLRSRFAMIINNILLFSRRRILPMFHFSNSSLRPLSWV